MGSGASGVPMESGASGAPMTMMSGPGIPTQMAAGQLQGMSGGMPGGNSSGLKAIAGGPGGTGGLGGPVGPVGLTGSVSGGIGKELEAGPVKKSDIAEDEKENKEQTQGADGAPKDSTKEVAKETKPAESAAGGAKINLNIEEDASKGEVLLLALSAKCLRTSC